MMSKILIRTTMPSSFSNPCVVIVALTNVWAGGAVMCVFVEVVRIGIGNDVIIEKLVGMVVALEFVMSISYAVFVLAEEIIGAVTDIGVGVLTGVNVTVWEAVKTDLTFVLPAPLEEDSIMPFCAAILGC